MQIVIILRIMAGAAENATREQAHEPERLPLLNLGDLVFCFTHCYFKESGFIEQGMVEPSAGY